MVIYSTPNFLIFHAYTTLQVSGYFNVSWRNMETIVEYLSFTSDCKQQTPVVGLIKIFMESLIVV